VDKGGVLLQQLSISPALAGAHPHFHSHAINVLVVGRRRWALVPPSRAEFALRPALEHFSRLRWGDADGEAGAEPPWLTTVQQPGDALFVPAQWEHATLSLADSVAVAAEFV
jgi:ribosomal protein L16 Arg81 hydroxylase